VVSGRTLSQILTFFIRPSRSKLRFKDTVKRSVKNKNFLLVAGERYDLQEVIFKGIQRTANDNIIFVYVCLFVSSAYKYVDDLLNFTKQRHYKRN